MRTGRKVVCNIPVASYAISMNTSRALYVRIEAAYQQADR